MQSGRGVRQSKTGGMASWARRTKPQERLKSVKLKTVTLERQQQVPRRLVALVFLALHPPRPNLPFHLRAGACPGPSYELRETAAGQERW